MTAIMEHNHVCYIIHLFHNSLFISRYGLQEGFENEVKSRCQKASVKYQQEAYVSLHENVPNYEEENDHALRIWY